MNKNRVEALSDGVFAIVITLLILDIRVPEVEYGELAVSLVAVLPRIFAYVISFGVIGVYWLAHHQSLQLIGKLNGFLIWLNLIYLLAVSFMPFPTALLGRYPMQPIPIVIYGLNLIVANTIGRVVSLYLRAHPELDSGYTHRARHKGPYLYIFVNGSYVIAMLLAFFAPIVSYALFVVVLLVVIVYYSFTPAARQGEGLQPAALLPSTNDRAILHSEAQASVERSKPGH
jgi:uncharacterized membrane protein